MQEALQSVFANGRTVLSIAHRLSTMREADAVCVLEDGAVAEFGPYDELIRRPGSRLKALVQKQLLV